MCAAARNASFMTVTLRRKSAGLHACDSTQLSLLALFCLFCPVQSWQGELKLFESSAAARANRRSHRRGRLDDALLPTGWQAAERPAPVLYPSMVNGRSCRRVERLRGRSSRRNADNGVADGEHASQVPPELSAPGLRAPPSLMKGTPL